MGSWDRWAREGPSPREKVSPSYKLNLMKQNIPEHGVFSLNFSAGKEGESWRE